MRDQCKTYQSFPFCAPTGHLNCIFLIWIGNFTTFLNFIEQSRKDTIMCVFAWYTQNNSAATIWTEHWCLFGKQKTFGGFRSICLSHPTHLKFSLPLGSCTAFSTIPEFFLAYCAACSVLVIYFPNPFQHVLPSVIKI